MNLIQRLTGRRQFLIASGLASTYALTCKKLAGYIDRGFHMDVAMAGERAGTAGIKARSNKYPHLLSPLKIGNVILKNRMLYTVSIPQYLQGPETFPTELIRSYYAQVAKNAAVVTVRMSTERPPRKDLQGDHAHMASWDGDDPSVHNYIDQMAECIHSMGSFVTASYGGTPPGTIVRIEDIVARAKFLEDRGIDMIAMGAEILQGKDSVRSLIDLMHAVRKATDIMIMMSIMVIEPGISRDMNNQPLSGFTLEEAIGLANECEDLADILVLKAAGGLANHPSSFNMEKGKPVSLTFAQAIKESGAKIIIAPNGGFHDADLNEEYIATGKADMIAMARPFIADPEYAQKAYEGRGEDIVPCIMCNRCHGTYVGPWFSVCSVNPKIGLSPVARVIDIPSISKKVAVIGGGPAGMKAAITAAERGHRVTLYEKNNYLGGLLRHADFSPYKWALKDYKDYLIRQTYKAGIEVLLNTEANPEMIRASEYDAVLVALGAEPVIPRIPGANIGNVWDIVNVYGNEKALGKNIVIVGGGQFGAETGMYLVKMGHRVTVLTTAKKLVEDGGILTTSIMVDMYERMDNFSYITEATVTRISKGKVIYVDAAKSEKSVNADSVVIYAGLRPKQDEAMKFYGSVDNPTTNAFFPIGDCTGRCGNVQKSIRSAYFAAYQV